MACTQGSPYAPLVLLLVILAGTALAQINSVTERLKRLAASQIAVLLCEEDCQDLVAQGNCPQNIAHFSKSMRKEALGNLKVCEANDTKIEENSPAGSVVTTIRADAGVTVIIEHSENSQLFEIIGNELILKGDLDFEKVGAAIVLKLTCQQDGSNVKNLYVTVEVLDVNDNIPVFAETSVSWEVPEDVAVGSSIGTLSAKDGDVSDTIYYDLQGVTAEGSSHFKLARFNSPVIQVSSTLDYDKFSFAQLILYARDTEVPFANNHTATATINVAILDVDNKNPWFIPCKFLDRDEKICLGDGYRVDVTRAANVTDALVLTPGPLYAIDGDKGINEAITYELISGNVDDIFAINNNTGNITMKKAPDILGTTVLNVMASQVNNYLRYATTTVEINVIQKNDHPPTFPRTDYNGTMPAYSVLGSLVMEYNSLSRPLKIFAEDDDFPDKKNPAITYSIENSIQFIISQEGFIQSNAELNSSVTIVFVVAALDRTSGEKATTPVYVVITPIIGPETTTNAPTTVTTTSAPPGLTSPALPPETATGTTKKPSETASTSSSSGSSATGITNKPTSPSTQTAVTTKTISGTPGKPATNNPTMAPSGVPPVPSLSMTSTTTPSAPLGSTSTKEPFTGTTITSSATTKISAAPSHGPPDSNTTSGPQTGTGSTTSRATTITVPISVTPPGSGTTKPSTPRTGPTTSAITTTTPPAGGSPGHGSTAPPKPGTSPSGIITTAAHSKPTGSVTVKPFPPLSRPTVPDSTSRTASTFSQHTTSVSGSQTGGQVLDSHQKYTAEDMAALGASLAAVLVICIAFLGFLIHKQYGCNFKKLSEMDIHSGSGESLEGNKKLIDNEYVDTSRVDPNEATDDGEVVNLNHSAAETTTDGSSVSGSMAKRATEDTLLSAAIPAAFTAVDRLEGDADSDKEVKSILTKERRVNDESYKAVWFKGDIEPDEVVMINEHEQTGEGQGDEDDDDVDNKDDEDNDDDNEGNNGPDDEGRSDNQTPKVAFSTNNVTADTDQSVYSML